MQQSVWILFGRLGIYPALGKMLGDTFVSLGWEVVIADRPLATVPDQGLLLWLGSGELRPSLIERLRERSDHRLVTALWQLEPLPPLALSPLGERVGLRVAEWDWNRLQPGATIAGAVSGHGRGGAGATHHRLRLHHRRRGRGYP